jgi:hypothetical protein
VDCGEGAATGTVLDVRPWIYNFEDRLGGEILQCGHCSADYHPQTATSMIGQDAHAFWLVEYETCPRCRGFNIRLAKGIRHANGAFQASATYVVHPRGGVSRKPVPPEVPQKLTEDYNEACLVLADSPKASAALSRRVLQIILREHAQVKPQDLSKEIDEVLASKQLPSHLAAAIDAVRHIGNFAAHPIKSTNTGTIVEVEPGEAEWSLDVVDGLFDFYFIGPAELQKKRDALNAKLAAAGKPALK